mmetsp:Transcript_20666/g.53704  ORF Transcript_20666/g.53704 Transcript_20666/m.53704 type:complete len:242 (+) Transcript_20666:53-778(+)
MGDGGPDPVRRCGGFDPCHLIWALALGAGAVVGTIGFQSGDWIAPRSNPNDVACGPFVFCVGDECRKYDPQKNDTWEAAMWLMAIGLAFVWLGVLGALLTVWLQEWQPIAHNGSMFGSVLTLVGLVTFAFGFENTRASRTEFAPCNFCGERTDVTQLEECSLQSGMIMMIVGVVVLFVAGVLGWTVNHRADAPEAYRQRTYTGRRRPANGTDTFRPPTKTPVVAKDDNGRWQKNTMDNTEF